MMRIEVILEIITSHIFKWIKEISYTHKYLTCKVICEFRRSKTNKIYFICHRVGMELNKIKHKISRFNVAV